ncbi:MAG: alpha/beta hydrolase fold-3 protein [Solirubrobacterales bacterium]|nr:alpha/beta hydrolase fold-3 protein [Solirubrobacterales bacterium]
MSSRTGLKRTDGQRLPLRLAALCGPSTLALSVAARHPTPAVRKVLDKVFHLVSAPHAKDAQSRDLVVDGADGARLAARLYEPEGVSQDAGLLVFFHGGGFVLGSLDSHANTCRFTARQAGCKVLAVGYRKPPEHRFPTAFQDCLAAYRWAAAHAAELGVDPQRIAVGGDSAGGNLAASVALHLDEDDVQPCLAWLIYPFVDADIDRHPSAQLFAAGPLLSRQCALDMLHQYAPGPREQLDERMTVIDADALDRMPPTYIATAGMDPLRDQGERFGERLGAAGVQVQVRRFTDLPHGFDLLLIDPGCRAATAETCDALARALARAGDRGPADVPQAAA